MTGTTWWVQYKRIIMNTFWYVLLLISIDSYWFCNQL